MLPSSPALRPIVRSMWTFDSSTSPYAEPAQIERVLPTGAMHLVVRLSPEPLTLFDDVRGLGARTFGAAVVGGPRSSSYVRAVGAPSRSVGVQLAPGAAKALFGMPADELSERHLRLEDLVGRDANELVNRVAEARTPNAALAAMESWMLQRFRGFPREAALVADAVRRLDAGASVGSVVSRCGYSHRTFLALFRSAVGLSPKTYARVARAQRALAQLSTKSSLVDVALAAGFSDQAHLSRELVAITGLTPTAYRATRPRAQNHVPVALK